MKTWLRFDLDCNTAYDIANVDSVLLHSFMITLSKLFPVDVRELYRNI